MRYKRITAVLLSLCMIISILAGCAPKAEETAGEEQITVPEIVMGTISPETVMIRTGENRVTLSAPDISFAEDIGSQSVYAACAMMNCEVTEVVRQDEHTLEIVFDAQADGSGWNSENVGESVVGYIAVDTAGTQNGEAVDALFNIASPELAFDGSVSRYAEKAVIEATIADAAFGEEITPQDIVLTQGFEDMTITDVKRVDEDTLMLSIAGEVRQENNIMGTPYTTGGVYVLPGATDAAVPAHGEVALDYVMAYVAETPSFSSEETLDVSVELANAKWADEISAEHITLKGAFEGKEVVEVFRHETDHNRVDIVIAMTQEECVGDGHILFEADAAEEHHDLGVSVYFDHARYYGTVEEVKHGAGSVSVTVKAVPQDISLTREITKEEIAVGGAFEGGTVTDVSRGADDTLIITADIPQNVWNAMDSYAGEFILPLDALESGHAHVGEEDAVIYANPHFMDEQSAMTPEETVQGLVLNNFTLLPEINMDDVKSFFLDDLKTYGATFITAIPNKFIDWALDQAFEAMGLTHDNTQEILDTVNAMYADVQDIQSRIKSMQYKLDDISDQQMKKYLTSSVGNAVITVGKINTDLGGYKNTFNDILVQLEKNKKALEEAEKKDEELRAAGKLGKNETSEETKAAQLAVDKQMMRLIDVCVTITDPKSSFRKDVANLGDMITGAYTGLDSGILQIYDQMMALEKGWESKSYNDRVDFYNYIAKTYSNAASLENAAVMILSCLQESELLRLRSVYKQNSSGLSFESSKADFQNLITTAQGNLESVQTNISKVVAALERQEPTKLADGYDRHAGAGVIVKTDSAKIVEYSKNGNNLMVSQEEVYAVVQKALVKDGSAPEKFFNMFTPSLYALKGNPVTYIPSADNAMGLSAKEAKAIMAHSKEDTLVNELASIGAIPENDKQQTMWLRGVYATTDVVDGTLDSERGGRGMTIYYQLYTNKKNEPTNFKISRVVTEHFSEDSAKSTTYPKIIDFKLQDNLKNYPNGLHYSEQWETGSAWTIQVVSHAAPEIYTVTEKVTAGLFEGNTRVTELGLADSVTTIGTAAYKNCTGLTNIKLPSKLTRIGDSAFEGCTGITEVTLPAGLEVIGENAFKGCTGITKITIPASVKTISKNAFAGCTSLKELVFEEKTDEKNISIGENAFAGTAIENLSLPGNLSSIGKNAFSGQSLKNLTITVNSAKDIPVEGSEDGLTSEVIPGITSLDTLTIGKSGGAINDGSFRKWLSAYGNISIGTLHIADGVTALGDSEFEDLGMKKAVLPESLTTMGTAAFKGCASLGELALGGLTAVPDEAFMNCANLTEIAFSRSVVSIGKNAFNGCGIWYMQTYAEYIGDGAFANNKVDSSIHYNVLGDVRFIGKNAFPVGPSRAVVMITSPGIKLSLDMFADPSKTILTAHDVSLPGGIGSSFYNGYIPVVNVAEKNIALTAENGGENVAVDKVVEVKLEEYASSNIVISTEKGSAWLKAGMKSQFEHNDSYHDLTVSADASGMEPGEYSDVVKLSDKSGIVLSEISVTLTVTAADITDPTPEPEQNDADGAEPDDGDDVDANAEPDAPVPDQPDEPPTNDNEADVNDATDDPAPDEPDEPQAQSDDGAEPNDEDSPDAVPDVDDSEGSNED